MKLRILFYGGLCVLITSCTVVTKTKNNKSKVAELFEQYKQHKVASKLPDFSYVGYHYGNVAIPAANHYKVFNVTDFGAVPNDTLSDKAAIQKAINAANKNGSGIVFFPKGKFLVNEATDGNGSILSKGGNIIFRGSGSGPDGTELFMKTNLPPKNPEQMWTVPPLFIFTSGGKDVKTGAVTSFAKKGSFTLQLSLVNNLSTGDWIMLTMRNKDTSLVNSELAPHKAAAKWVSLLKDGVEFKLYYQVAKVTGNRIELEAPLPCDVDPVHNWDIYQFANSEEVGIENIAFTGNWKEPFVHHRSWQDDSGFTLFRFSRCTNSWMKDCRFSDCNVAAIVTQSANITIRDCKVTGNAGHEAITKNGATNILMENLVDEASMWHSFGSSHGAMNTVIVRCTYPSTTCFEAHASQPRNTLFDLVQGGLMQNRGGGALENMPNHMSGLVLWNYTQTNSPIKDFEFWPASSPWWKIPNPIIVGFRGNGTTFNKEQVGYLESVGKFVTPNSLYEAQLAFRLKSLLVNKKN
ncbi:MAG: DUF4955 domain-containing protein [Chitinophagaceae bacterium]